MIVASLLLIFAAVVMLVVGVAGHSDPALIGSIIGTLMAVVVLIGSARRAATVRLAAAADGTGVGPTVHSGLSSGIVIDGTVVERPAGRSTAAAAHPHSTVLPDQAPPVDVPPDEVDEGVQTATIPTRQRQPVDPDPIVLIDFSDDLDSGDDLISRDDEIPEADPIPGGDPVDADRLAGDDDLGDFEDEDPPDEPPAQLISANDQTVIAQLVTNVLVVDGRPRYHVARCPHLIGRVTEPVPVREAVELGFTPCGRCEPATALLAGARQN